MGTRILRPKQAMAKLGIGHTKFYELRKTGVVPKPVRLGARAVGYLEDELDGAIDKLKAARDNSQHERPERDHSAANPPNGKKR